MTWPALSRFTPARIGLGRVGSSLPTAPLLDFSMAHARARDAVNMLFLTDTLEQQLNTAGFSTHLVHSQAPDRATYLHRPDLGRQLAPACIERLRIPSCPRRLSFIVADGLSAAAPMRHALPLLAILRPHLTEWTLDDVVIATQARVALGDEVGALRGAEAVVILIGERPGLNSPDSLSAYITYSPCVGRNDAERNCISNIHPQGLPSEEAANKLFNLLTAARALGKTGVELKDKSEVGGKRLTAL